MSQEPQPDAVQADEVKPCHGNFEVGCRSCLEGAINESAFAHKRIEELENVNCELRLRLAPHEYMPTNVLVMGFTIDEISKKIKELDRAHKRIAEQQAKIDEMELEKDVAVAGLHAFTKQAEGQLEESRLQIQAQKKVINKLCFAMDQLIICDGTREFILADEALQSAAALEKK